MQEFYTVSVNENELKEQLGLMTAYLGVKQGKDLEAFARVASLEDDREMLDVLLDEAGLDVCASLGKSLGWRTRRAGYTNFDISVMSRYSVGGMVATYAVSTHQEGVELEMHLLVRSAMFAALFLRWIQLAAPEQLETALRYSTERMGALKEYCMEPEPEQAKEIPSGKVARSRVIPAI